MPTISSAFSRPPGPVLLPGIWFATQSTLEMEIGQAIEQLRPLNEPVPKPLRLPTQEEVRTAEQQLGIEFPPDYRRYLLEASDVVFGTKEPCVLTVGPGHMDLPTTAREAWKLGVPGSWLAFCEDNGDYYCLDGDAVRFWSHDGESNDHWPDLGTWITDVWIGEA
jgi:SMI1-KNR4 cell-wall